MKFFTYAAKTARLVVAGCFVALLSACGGDSEPTGSFATQAISESDAVDRGASNEGASNTLPATVVDVAVSDGRFTTLVAALQATDLDTVLGATDQTFTVFAPTDDAFNLLPSGTVEALLQPEGLSTLTDILLYHVVAGLPEAVPADVAISLASLGAPDSLVPMANGDTVELTLQGPTQDLFVNESQVIITNIITGNGIIHVIDAVLSPPEEMMSATPTEMMDTNDMASLDSPDNDMNMSDMDSMNALQDQPVVCEADEDADSRSVMAAISAEPDLATLTALLELTGLNEVLRNIFTESAYTVFAPTEAAFESFISSLEPAVSEQLVLFGVESLATTVGLDTLRDILLYHVLGLAADFDTAFSLAGSQEKTDRIIATLNGDAVQLTQAEGDKLFVNNSEVVCEDIGAKNGIVHKIDKVLQFPTDVDVVHVAALKPELSTFYSLIKLTDLDHLLRASQEVTILAPSDDAFAEIPQATLDYLLSEAGGEELIQILKQHIVIQQPAAGDKGIAFSTALQANGLVLETAAGPSVTLTVQSLGGHVTIGGAPVIDPDQFGTNGVIHTIGSVIVNPQ